MYRTTWSNWRFNGGVITYEGAGDTLFRTSVAPHDVADPGEAAFSNEELAVALQSICLPFSQYRLRLGAAMTAAHGNSPAKLARLAVLERCHVVLRHVARCGAKVEPSNPFWTELLALLPKSAVPPPDTLPHITRYVAMTGITRRGRETLMQWIRPSAAPLHEFAAEQSR